MDLSKTVACTALLLIVLLSAGHALAQSTPRKPVPKKPVACEIKPVMTDAEIEACRNDAKKPSARVSRSARRSGA
jgi:hypothetical protein